jgi:hypothetical protein
MYLLGYKELTIEGDLNIGVTEDGKPTSPFITIGAQLVAKTEGAGVKCFFNIASVLESNKMNIASYLNRG